MYKKIIQFHLKKWKWSWSLKKYNLEKIFLLIIIYAPSNWQLNKIPYGISSYHQKQLRYFKWSSYRKHVVYTLLYDCHSDSKIRAFFEVLFVGTNFLRSIVIEDGRRNGLTNAFMRASLYLAKRGNERTLAYSFLLSFSLWNFF